MEFLKLKISDYKENEDNYNDYKNKLEKIKELMKESNKYKNIYESMDSLNNKSNFYLYYLLFQNYEKWSNIQFENNINEENKFSLIIKFFLSRVTKNNNKNIKLFPLFILWRLFLYNEFIINLYKLNPNYYELNRIRYIYRETNNLIIKLFKENIINTDQIFLIMNFSIFLIETNFEIKSYSDKLYKAKNYLLLKGLFFLFQETSSIILSKINMNKIEEEKDNKSNVEKMFNFLEELQNNSVINSHLNKMILINNNFLLSLLTKILDKINIQIIEKYEPKYKKKFLGFFSNFLKSNYKKSKIYNFFLNTLKQSFINLYNFEDNKEKIIHDLFVNSFNSKLLKEIFNNNEKINDISRPLFDSFYFNGFDSQISLNVQNNTFEKSTLFFSFYLCPLNGRKQYPLFLVRKDFDGKKDDLLNLYLKESGTKSEKDLKEYDLYISIEGKEIILNSVKIKSNTTYYFSICFNLNKLLVNFCSNKDEIFSKEINKNNKLIAINSISLYFGFNKKKVNVFSGYFGPIIILRNPKNAKELNDFILSILKLENNYKNFLFSNQPSNYLFEEDFLLKNPTINELEHKYEKIECLLYLIPETFKYFSDKSRVLNHLPNIDNICKIQREYMIYNLNITLINQEKGIINFIMDNGLNFICLFYEYIYQFAENYQKEIEQENNSFIIEKDILIKMVSSIFKNTLFILEKSYNEINVINLNNSLKQVYMNLFYSIKSISKIDFIIDNLIDYFFSIIKYYHNYINNFINKKKLFNFEVIELKNDEIYKNQDLLIYLNCINGLIDFLLNYEIYNFKSNETLIKLFNEFSSIFNYLKLNKASEKINQNLYLKLLNFIPFIYRYYEQENSGEEDGVTQKTDDKEEINSVKSKKDIFDYFFNTMKVIFENNPSKSENIMNLKNIFMDANDYLGENHQIFYKFNNFINELIGNNPDLYFNDNENNEQIKNFINYASKFSSHSSENLKDEKEINKKNLFNKLISILIRIIFTKSRIGRNDEIIQKFRKLIGKVEKNKDLITTICNEILNIFNHNFGLSESLNSENQKEKTIKIIPEEIKKLSKYYYEIFNLILYFIENQNNNNNDKTNNDIYNNEMIIIELLNQITNMIKTIIDNINKLDITNSSNLDSYNNNFLDIILCLINFLKFYKNILYKKLYSTNFVQNFVNVCELCCQSSLIYTNILINEDEDSIITKIPLEIILDICIFYTNLTSIKYSENISDKEINKEEIIEQQKIIYNFLKYLLYPNNSRNSKEIKNKYSIFYINDYFRLLSYTYPIEGKKKPKNDPIYSEFEKEFQNYLYIEKVFSTIHKYNFNVSTFFILKCSGYKKILFELIVKVLMIDSQAKDFLKFDDILTLIIEILQRNYNEHEILYSKNKNFFFTSKKANTSYCYYTEIKKRIESNLKKNNYQEIDTYILNKIFFKDFDNIYSSIYSGCCTPKKPTEHKLSVVEKEKPSIKEVFRHALSSTDVIKDLNKSQIQGMDRTFSDGKKIQNLNTSEQQEESSSMRKESSITPEEEFECILKVEEMPFSYNNKFNTPDDNLKADLIMNSINSINSDYSSPLISEKRKERKQTIASTFSLGDYNEYSELKPRKRNYSIFSQKSIDNNNEKIYPYTNYFYIPDENFILNPKKELMMNVFSIYFFDSFFINDNFITMKNYYIQNFEGIQKSTKLLDFPTKIKNYNNGLEPCLFLKPFSTFFIQKVFPISHKYYQKIIESNINEYEPIILLKKILPYFYLEGKFDKKCELIKINRSYYGHILGSEKANFIIFEQKKYEFYEDFSSESSKSKIFTKDLNDLFTLSNVNKKPFNKSRKKSSVNIDDKKRFQQKKYKSPKILIIIFDEIEEILERRFLLMWQSIEIYLKNGKSYFFNFLSKDQYDFILEIFKNNPKTQNKIHERNFFKLQQKNLISEWLEERLNTYEYLLFLNKYSSRTFNDVNQYPIFPWIIKKYQVNTEKNTIDIVFRDFKYPMAAQNEDSRRTALNRFEDDEESKVKFPTHFGTHYSTSSYIYFYLMREEPYTTLLIKLQGYNQENPDRMFLSIVDTLYVLESGTDNRECIPDIICKTEQFINLNCNDFGRKNNGLRVDDFIIYNNNFNIQISDFVEFTIENRKLLDTKLISLKINDWFDNIFGIGQLPEKNLKKSLNIFSKESYEQKTQINKKLIKLQNKYKQKEDIIIRKIENKIDLIISFGQAPYQLFTEKHPKSENQKKNKEKFEDYDEEDDFEAKCINTFWDKNKTVANEIQPLFFEINISIGKIFLLDMNRQLEIINSNYYDYSAESKDQYYFYKLGVSQLSHIKFHEKVKIQDNPKCLYYIYNPKYCFSSFNNNICEDNSNNNEYFSYYNLYLKNLYKENIKESKKGKVSNEDENITFITCRYMDNSFKIHQIIKTKKKQEEKSISIICEDFVSSCCALNYNQFLVGLKNGKLIQWSIEKDINNDKSSVNINYKIKFKKQIQAHKKSITLIEFDFRLGILITGGEDNYIFIRKLYDLELIIPIKLKSKYIIRMVKVSPMNFLYIICFNKKKKKNKSIILGFTLNGLYFGKSKYGYFESIDFTKNGNIVTFNNKKEIEILSGVNLKNINIDKNDQDMNDLQSKISNAFWVKFNYFYRKNEIEPCLNKIITFAYFDKNKEANHLETFDASKIKYFD